MTVLIIIACALIVCTSTAWGPWLVGPGRDDWSPYDEMDQR